MSKAQSYERSRTRIAVLLRLIAGLCGFAFLIAEASPDDSPVDDISLPADHGYVLIRTIMIHRYEQSSPVIRNRIIFDNYDTGTSFNVRTKTPYSAGVNAWLSLISATKGHYYFSRYTSFRNPVPIPKAEVSASDIFEVKSGVVNYVGDWNLTNIRNPNLMTEDWQRRFPLDVTYDLATIEKSMARFPEHLRKYEVFISIKGKQAISLNDFSEIVKQHSGSDDE